MKKPKPFATEVELCAAFPRGVRRDTRKGGRLMRPPLAPRQMAGKNSVSVKLNQRPTLIAILSGMICMWGPPFPRNGRSVTGRPVQPTAALVRSCYRAPA